MDGLELKLARPHQDHARHTKSKASPDKRDSLLGRFNGTKAGNRGRGKPTGKRVVSILGRNCANTNTLVRGIVRFAGYHSGRSSVSLSGGGQSGQVVTKFQWFGNGHQSSRAMNTCSCLPNTYSTAQYEQKQRTMCCHEKYSR